MSSPILVLAAVLVYFGFVSLVLGFVMLPSWRDAVRRRVAALAGRPARAPAPAAPAGTLPAPASARSAPVPGDPDAVPRPDWISGPLAPRHALAALLTAACVAAGPATALLLRDRLPPVDEPFRGSWADERVAAALWSPPEVQAPTPAPDAPGIPARASVPAPQPAAAVIDPPGAADAGRDWSLLDPRFRERLLAVFEVARQRHGYELVLLEGWRSAGRQAELAALGPTRTLAGPHRSRHQAGLAADVAFRRDGRLVVSETDPWALQAYRHYGEIARSMGLDWGGDWSTLKDLGHVELRLPPADASGPASPRDALVALR